jgi:TRAP-type C4-dicarboxylate transport system permease small subunit
MKGLSVDGLVSQHERQLKTRALDYVEYVLMICGGILILGFTFMVGLDVATRLLHHPLLWLQETIILAFVWGIFIGAAVALRRGEHFYVFKAADLKWSGVRVGLEYFNAVVMLVISAIALYYGYLNYREGFGNHLSVTKWPLAVITGAIPVFGLFAVIFTLERLVMGWRNGFRHSKSDEAALDAARGI